MHATHATVLRHSDQLAATDLQLQELLAARLQQNQLQDTISMLHSRQDQLQHQQQLDECQHSVVFKDSQPLPSQGAAQHLQSLLSKQLGLRLTVQKVQQLHSRQPLPGGDSKQLRHSYKVTLGSSGERTAVLRAKAAQLRGTSMSIDALLTAEQLASKQRLLPVARQAKAAGQSVRWRYGTLFVDGKEYTGAGSLPSPADQQRGRAAAASGQQHAQQADEEGWQPVLSKKKKPQQQQQRASKPKPTAKQQAVAAAISGNPAKAPTAAAGTAGAAKAPAKASNGNSSSAAAAKGLRPAKAKAPKAGSSKAAAPGPATSSNSPDSEPAAQHQGGDTAVAPLVVPGDADGPAAGRPRDSEAPPLGQRRVGSQPCPVGQAVAPSDAKASPAAVAATAPVGSIAAAGRSSPRSA